MRIAFRLDASKQIGMGHVMRCLTLADCLKRRGARVRFVCRHLQQSMRARIRSADHEVVLLDAPAEPSDAADVPQSHLLETTQQQDAADCLAALADADWDWLIVDHYALDARWESALRARAKRIMVVDDTADRSHDCDLLLDQNLFPDMHTRYLGRVSASTGLLLGPHYAMLRPEFQRLRAQARPRSGRVGRIFILFGGVDPHDLTGRALEALRRIDPALGVDVVIGDEHPHRAQIQSACAASGYECHVQTDRVAELMTRADLALGAGGSASWERCCLGLATICVSFAQNQLPIARALQEAGACLFLGDQAEATVAILEAAVLSLMADPNRLRDMAARCAALVDGRGAERVSDAMSGYQ